MPNRSSTTRRTLTMVTALIPGAGQLTSGRLARGVMGMLIVSLCTSLVLAHRFIFEPFLPDRLELTLIVIAITVYLAGIIDTAYLVKIRFNRVESSS